MEYKNKYKNIYKKNINNKVEIFTDKTLLCATNLQSIKYEIKFRYSTLFIRIQGLIK